MALRGHGDNEGNFYELLQLRANDIPELKEWLQRKRAWLTHDNQNEILELLALEVMRKLNNSIKEDEYFSLIVDGTTDVSTKEQVALCIRHVNGDFEVSEDFIGLYETSSTTGETLTKIIQDVLLRLDLNIDNCRGQCYDGAGNMKGHMKAQVDRVKQRLTKLRTDEKFNELWEKVKKRGADMDLLPVTLPRVRAPPKRLEQKSDASPPVTFSGPETYLRKQYFDVLDNLNVCSNCRKNLFLSSSLENVAAFHDDAEEIEPSCNLIRP
ncbi:zinc finger MYM-type protein 1-like [Macrosteles quadrilineatus]|uniref:zinc finger MYM-type protein 1-like n=1 Tax=Macrosteles quadrilineatus TaxID=74068 RepID=UPI0023E24C03|nr:zinc finger MYM-type protein 1-like [Macrosteles quadrilineatus]